MRLGLGGILYLIIGVAIAASHHYLAHINAIKPIVSVILAIVLWPLLLFGVNLHVR